MSMATERNRLVSKALAALHAVEAEDLGMWEDDEKAIRRAIAALRRYERA